MSPIDVVLDRLGGHRLRRNGSDRWRACCPAHSGSNPSALSIGVGAKGQVLLKCWSGCDAEAIAGALGLEFGALFPLRESGAGKPARRRMLTASQALNLLEVETLLVVVCAADMAAGRALDDSTRERLTRAAARVTLLHEETHA